ncbi:MAG TPA: TauD/TfdA family dioxygenase [Acidimicrobiales bacterium]|nr:TauD/TfdA family dioxygenase [Acidimicrobiales bacterium]
MRHGNSTGLLCIDIPESACPPPHSRNPADHRRVRWSSYESGPLPIPSPSGVITVSSSLDLQPLNATFGAMVTGVDLAALDEDTWQAIHAAWLEYALLIFPDQNLTDSEQIALARRFGDIELIGGREIVPLSNVRSDGTLIDESHDSVKILKGNMGWHADSTYMDLQAKGAVFSARVVPPEGGGTAWADMRAAYEALPEDLRTRVQELSAYHSLYYSQSKVGHEHSENTDYIGYGFHGQDPPLRPLVKIHPETGRRSLLIGRHAYGIPGLDPDESERLLDELVEFACQPPRVHEHRWTPGEVVVWDNRCLLHRARPWDMTQPRVMMHTRIAGDRPHELAMG